MKIALRGLLACLAWFLLAGSSAQDQEAGAGGEGRGGATDLVGDRDLQVDPSYVVDYNATSRCVKRRTGGRKIKGHFYVSVKDSAGAAVRKADVSLVLSAQDGSTRSYSSSGKTSKRGVAKLLLKNIRPKDGGQMLWCSIAIPNPDLPFSQQVPCLFTPAKCP